jgi:hypothetical protein
VFFFFLCSSKRMIFSFLMIFFLWFLCVCVSSSFGCSILQLQASRVQSSGILQTIFFKQWTQTSIESRWVYKGPSRSE